MLQQQSTIFSRLGRPFPLETDQAKRVLVSVIFGVAVASVLLVFEPFGLSQYQSEKRTLHIAFYGIITFLGMMFNFFIPSRFFPQFFEEERWTVGKHILLTLWNIISIGVLNFLYSNIVFAFNFSWQPLFSFILWAFFVGAIPVIIWTLLLERRYWKHNVAGAAKLTSTIEQQESKKTIQSSTPKLITLSGTSIKEQYEINPASILCIQASDNYVTLFYESSDTIKKILFRATLKSLEEQLAHLTNFFRCHKSYIVNLARITNVSGNAQGYKLHLPFLEFVIPVSRSLQTEILEKVQHIERG